MNNCSNCYNGCAEIISDRCVRYTGVNVPILGIQNGDSLSYVEQALATYLVSALDASGIYLDGLQSSLCPIIQECLPATSVELGLTALDLFTALVGATCKLSEEVMCLQKKSLAYSYELGCLTIDQQSSTEQVLQAVINLLCTVNASLTALSLDVSTNYVPLSQLNALIAAYLASQSSSTQLYNTMIPYAIIPVIPSNVSTFLANFDSSGAGLVSKNYQYIYLCNGYNGTQDLRGVTLVGSIAGVPGPTMNSAVDPAISGNPNYDVSTGYLWGANTITLAPSQIPQTTHTHTVTDPGHTHTVGYYNAAGGGSGAASGIGYSVNQTYTTPSNTTGITLTSTSLYGNGTGDGGASSHNNIQPVKAVFYITYIPA